MRLQESDVADEYRLQRKELRDEVAIYTNKITANSRPLLV